MQPHYHVWIRAGRIFSMRMAFYDSRATAARHATQARPDSRDRLVLACTDCPTSTPSTRSKRKLHVPDRIGLSRQLAQRLDVPIGTVASALDAVLDGNNRREGKTNRDDATGLIGGLNAEQA